MTLRTVAHKTPQSIEFFRQEYWSGLSFPSPGDLPDPGIEPGSPALQADSLPTEPPGNRKRNRVHNKWTALETSQNLLSKNCLPKILPRSRKELQVYSAVPGCWLREMLKQGCSQEVEPPLHGVLNRPPIALVMIREICFIFFKYPCGINLKLSNSFTVFLRKSFHEVPTVMITVLIYLIVLLILWV